MKAAFEIKSSMRSRSDAAIPVVPAQKRDENTARRLHFDSLSWQTSISL
jgi:hypothetical protein